MVGTLQKEKLTLSEIRRFPNEPIEEKGVRQWNIPYLYQEVLHGLTSAGSYDEPVDSLSCTSWGGDYLLFQSDGTLLTPAYLQDDARAGKGTKAVLSAIPWETIYEETGVAKKSGTTLFQLGAEASKRLKRAKHLLPIADGFNYLLAGVPRVETSQASAAQLLNPVTGNWSDPLVDGLRLPDELLPPIVSAGTELGPLREEVAKETKMRETRVIASCSHELAAALTGLPVADGESWAFLRPGTTALIGTQVARPIINEVSRDLNFTNELGYGDSVSLYKPTVGLWVLEECQRFWEKQNRQFDPEMLGHLAGSATPFESLIDPTDPRFLEPGDMPLKIQAYCKETDQPIPHKPGPLFRCILESLALHYRKVLREVAYLSGSEVTRLYSLGDASHSLLNHFTANALQLPVVIVPENAAAIGNIVVQALALGHIASLDDAREIVRQSIKTETIMPHATAWNEAYDRFVSLVPAPAQ
jgi:rhamnulokinase